MVGTVLADSPNSKQYTLVAGEGDEDNAKFTFSSYGSLSFRTAPNYENPTDLGDTPGNNTYSIRVRVTAPPTTGPYTEQVFIITVRDVDEAIPVVAITAPDKLSNQPITTMTIRVQDDKSIDASAVTIDSTTTAGTANFYCTQTSIKQVDCTITITSSGNIVIRAIDGANKTAIKAENGYVIDTESPATTLDQPEAITAQNVSQ